MFRDEPHIVVSAAHHKMGRGGANLVTKLRNLLTGAIFETTFSGNERLEEADISYKNAQFLYLEGEMAYFMLMDNFETISLKLDSEVAQLLKEEMPVDLMLWQERAIDVKLPAKIVLEVKYTEPGFKGNTASGGTTKPATLETGAVINVPLFINAGDKIEINTDTKEYSKRA